jgi:thiamine-monophosphate kinase
VKKTPQGGTLEGLGEVDMIRLIQSMVSAERPHHLVKGIGDDCAVLKTPEDRELLVTTDTLIEGVHFTNQTLSPALLGWKSLAVSVSDIAAMGGKPHTAFLAMSIQRSRPVDFVKAFMEGFRACAGDMGVALAGGDVTESQSSAVITVTVLGACLSENVVYRSGAGVGDDVWVTGPLGNAAGGLFLLLNRKVSEHPHYSPLIMAHQKPSPPLDVGMALGESGLVHAMIDISDGIAKDLGHICEESGVGAMLVADALPTSEELERLTAEAGKEILGWALQGGEDYELLFTASPGSEERILSVTEEVSGRPAVKIGTIISGEGVWLETEKGREPLAPGGFVHFSK